MKKYRWMNDLVILPLHAYETDPLYSTEDLHELAGIFNREGRYFERRNNIAWKVIKGRAYLMDVNEFKYDLLLISAENNQLTSVEREALKTLKAYHSVWNSSLQTRLDLDSFILQLRAISRNGLRAKKRLKEFLLKFGC